jgi:lambda family phage portal protein
MANANSTLGLDTPSMAQARAQQNRARLDRDAVQIATRIEQRTEVVGRLDSELERAALQRKLQRAQFQRTYQAAMPSRQTSDWSLSQTSANSESRRSLRGLRARSREEQRNNGPVKKVIAMYGNEVVGPEGMTLSDVIEGDEDNEQDTALNELVIEGFKEWAKMENASSSGEMSWPDQQKLAMETVARDGEVLIRKRFDAPNPFGFALQFMDVAWLDETFNTILPNGNRVLMSIELDDFDRRVAYYLTRPSSDYLYPEYGSPLMRTRVPASEIIHTFLITEHEAQVRGIPWLHAIMEMLHTQRGYVDAELYASRRGACVTDYLIPPKNDEYNELYSGDDAKAAQVVPGYTPGAINEVEPAGQQIVPPGWDVKGTDPKHPNANFDGFMKGSSRYIAAGSLVPYFRMFSDLEGVNYTSSRAGDNEAHDFYRFLQRWLKDHLCRRVFFDVVKSGMLTGAIPIGIADYVRLDPTFDPRGWDSVDRQKDATADIMNIGAALDTHTRVAAERGYNWRKIVKKLGAEKKMLEAAGVTSEAFMPKIAAAPENMGGGAPGGKGQPGDGNQPPPAEEGGKGPDSKPSTSPADS